MKKEALGRKPAKAYGGNGRSAVYEYGDNTGYMKNRGSFTWRNNNPGAINSSKFAQRHGGIGNNGRFAVFPDYATGRNATYKLLQASRYNTVSLGQAFYAYAPPQDGNDTEAYIRDVVLSTGLDRDKPMADLTLKQRWSIVDAIIKHEKYEIGDIVPVSHFPKKYKWRTLKDKNVRDSHKPREGKIYYWNNPPKGGHHGEDHGCRCWPEAFDLPKIKSAYNPYHMTTFG